MRHVTLSIIKSVIQHCREKEMEKKRKKESLLHCVEKCYKLSVLLEFAGGTSAHELKKRLIQEARRINKRDN